MILIKDTRTTIQVALLAVAAGISTIIMLQNQADEESNDYRQPTLGLAYFLKSAEVRGTGNDGKVLYRLKADRAEQHSDNNYINLENIELSYEPSAEVPWDMFADTGYIPPDGKLIELRGNVRILSQEPDKPQTSIRTSQIDLLTDEKIATTDKKVVIEREGQKVNGTGMEAYLDQSKVKLLSNVNGTYVP